MRRLVCTSLRGEPVQAWDQLIRYRWRHCISVSNLQIWTLLFHLVVAGRVSWEGRTYCCLPQPSNCVFRFDDFRLLRLVHPKSQDGGAEARANPPSRAVPLPQAVRDTCILLFMETRRAGDSSYPSWSAPERRGPFRDLPSLASFSSLS